MSGGFTVATGPFPFGNNDSEIYGGVSSKPYVHSIKFHDPPQHPPLSAPNGVWAPASTVSEVSEPTQQMHTTMEVAVPRYLYKYENAETAFSESVMEHPQGHGTTFTNDLYETKESERDDLLKEAEGIDFFEEELFMKAAPINVISPSSLAASSAPSSAMSSPIRNPIEAGKRKLEEFKRKKLAALAAKKVAQAPTSAQEPLTLNNEQGQDARESSLLAGRLAAAEDRIQKAERQAAEATHRASELDAALIKVLRQLESVDSERNSLQREKADLLGEIIMVKSSHEGAQQNRFDLEIQLQEAHSRIETLERDQMNKNDTKEATELQEQIERMKALMAGKDMHIEQLSRSSAETEAELAALKEIVAQENMSSTLDQQNLQIQVDSLQSIIAQKDRELVGERESFAEVEASLHQDISDLKEDIQEMRDSLREAMAEREALEATVAALEQQLSDRESQMKELSFELEQIKKERDAVRAESQRVLETAALDTSNARNDLAAALHDVAASKSEAETLKSEVEVLKQQVETATGGRQGRGNDPGTLRLRLEKAEMAVEQERRRVSALERQIRDQQLRTEEGTRATEAALDLRRRCEELERQVVQAQAALQAAGSVSSPCCEDEDKKRHLSEAMQEQLAATESEVLHLRAQCAAAAGTVEKLLEENALLTDRINGQSNEIQRLRDAMAAANRFAVEADAALASTPSSATVEGGLHRQVSWSLPGGLKLPGDATLGSGAPTPLTSGDYSAFLDKMDLQPLPPGVPGYNAMNRRSSAERLSASSPKQKEVKKKGYSFWAWVAGADIADDSD